MIRAIVFDIGNVLLKFDFNLAIQKIIPLCRNVGPTLLAPIEEIKNAYEGGKISRDEFLREVFALLEFSGTEGDFVAAWEDIFEENHPMIELVDSLHGRYPLYLLSNTSDIHMDYIVQRYGVFGKFDDGVYSYKVGCAKPDPSIYELAAQQFGLNPAETVFIDDLSANIASAKGVGYHAVQYDFRDHASLVNALTELGVSLAPR